MKYSNYFGSLFSVLIIVICFVPWVIIPSIGVTITGFNAPGTDFGKPGLMNMFMSSIAFILFLVPAIWAKRTNLFIVTFNLAWAIRNYLILTHCEMGDCPQVKSGLYILVSISFLMLIMSLFPKVDSKQEK